MKIRNRLKLVFRSITKRVFVLLLLVAMCFMSFYMMDTVLVDYLADAYLIDKVMSMYGVEPERAVYVELLDHDHVTIEMSDSIKEYLRGHSGVEACGYYSKHATIDLWTEDGVFLVVAEKSLINLGNLKLTEEEKLGLLNYSGEYEPVLLGSNYRGKVNVGDIFSLGYDKENNCKVIGFLDEGASWVKDQGLFNGASNFDSYTLDDQGVLITGNYEDYSDYFRMAEDVNYIVKEGMADQVASDVKRFAVENNMSVAVKNHGSEIAKELEDNNIAGDKTFIATVLLVVLAVLSMSITSVVYCILNRKQYGVMLVTGVRRYDIEWIMVVQNAIVLVLSAIVAWIIRQQEIFGTLTPDPAKEQVLFIFMPYYVCHNVYIPVIFIGLVIFMLFITSIMPIAYIRNVSLVKLIHSKE